jgi:hypothetical protein
MALPQERRSALEYQFYGVQAVHIHQNHPNYTNSVLGQYQTTSCSIPPFWFGDNCSCQYLVLLQGFAIAQAWYFVLRDTITPAYHSMNPCPHVALS